MTNSHTVSAAFIEQCKKIKGYEEALALVYWDMRTGIPTQGTTQRSNVVGLLSAEIFRLSTEPALIENVTYLEAHHDELEPLVQALVTDISQKTARFAAIPPAEYEAYTVLQSNAEAAWEEARAQNDYSLFQPYLAEIIAYKKKFISYWGEKDTPYDTLLDQFEPGMTVAVLDELFAEVRTAMVDLLKRTQAAEHQPDASVLERPFAKDKQIAFSEEVLQKMGFDFESGRIDDTIHPFAISLNQGDVRITTRYDELNFKTAVLGLIHEGGHAIYEQNIDAQYDGTPLSEGVSMGIHESQSLFYEIILGSSEAFWQDNYARLQHYAQPAFDDVPFDVFYEALNETKPSLIRIEADILTYALHIIIRYEIEKALFNDNLDVAEVQTVWQAKYQEHLGITPANDVEGLLQDIHWAGGDFGYFPSYLLGLLNAAQLEQAMRQTIDIESVIASGNYLPIKNWLTEHVHQYGKTKTPTAIMKNATGASLQPRHLIDFLEKRYTSVYKLK
ncbi:carboxypeptidase M32 [Brochothrix campestris]|uniref:Metal-dependent carboxypeptidase n=1 Tax=Brochothrix campestris FSL F6-1037 TaxID=1265861 RepID=W7CH96_9LIST|nr:carboxypeptidase M32 [Brochothrix campestris]EUJ36322.1 peptidase M32 carboxypeptidase Taq metallopeptidase [Brochothrix campestris FSL F6-1037]